MVHIEERIEGKKKKYYLAKTIRDKDKVRKKRIFLGADLNTIQIEKLKKDAMIELGEIDFETVLSKKDITEFEKIKDKLNKQIANFDKDSFYELFVSEFTYDSNAIEGSTLTLDETNQILFEGISPKGKPLVHVQEAKNHKEAYDFIIHNKRKKLDTKFLCELQRIVVKETRQNGIGELRNVNVRVGTHVASPFYSVPRKLTALVKWFNSNFNKHNPVVVSTYFHAMFEEIHPFVDGNGRSGRLLLNLMLQEKGFPPLIIFFEQRQAYYTALEKARIDKNLLPLIKLIKKCYEKMLKKLENK